jgi:hypothetical protein
MSIILLECPLSLARKHYLNPALVQQQALTVEQVWDIINLHTQMEALINRCRRLEGQGTILVGDMSDFGKEIETLEFEIQSAWGFEKNPAMHTHWRRIPQCSCDCALHSPLHAARIPNENCPVHMKEGVLDDNA